MGLGTVGVLTIGQSPRTDVTPSIEAILGQAATIIESGGLNSLTDETISSIEPDEEDTTYISRMRNGNSVKIGKSKLLPLLQTELAALEETVDIVLMLCTGDFPTLQSKKTIVYPDRVLNHVVSALLPSGSLGLIIPLEEQRETLLSKWQQKDLNIFVEVASPYEESDIAGAASALQKKGATLLVLDCMGYNEQHKTEAVKSSGLPVILPRTLVARILAEYMAE
ncbi:AroM family protein [Sporosarcina cyprini]|uniref:AroM family protein n=1 Tax=Sporosarcina cyprini TaxID=2910523 RepID=UPI001EDD98E1|nr:AroM family protein [Sporosarcina cyprini]MCG3088246.1 AroM family protein [Sporosarcina cyprini]